MERNASREGNHFDSTRQTVRNLDAGRHEPVGRVRAKEYSTNKTEAGVLYVWPQGCPSRQEAAEL